MTTFTIAPDDLPAAQFTAGSLLKTAPEGTKLADVRAALDVLVDAGTLTVKVAGSGARNYKLAGKAKTNGAAPAKRPSEKAMEATDPAPVASSDRAERVKLAKQEAAALKAWERKPDGDRPATPNLDAVAAKTPTAKTRSTSETGSPRGTTVQFVVDGKPMPASQNKLSSVAWAHTKGIGGENVDRVSVTDLRALFTAAGVADPSNTVGVDVTLPNGKRVTTTAL